MNGILVVKRMLILMDYENLKVVNSLLMLMLFEMMEK